MKPSKRLALVAICGLCCSTSSAYEVWMGTHRMHSDLATQPASWARTAAWVDGVNFNRSPSDTSQANGNQREDVIRRVSHVNNMIVGVPRSAVTRTTADEAARTAISESIAQSLRASRADGARLNEFMLYDERHSDGIVYEWSRDEIQIYREELDRQGQQDAKLIWRAANNARRNLENASLPVIDGLLIEGSATRFVENNFNVNTLARNFWNSSVNANKELYLQMPRSEDPNQNQYEATRRAVLEMKNVLGVEGVRSNRLVIMPVTYGDTPLQVPETVNNGTAYPNTMPGIQLSLIEQRPYFEGRMGELPANFAASTERIPMSASIASEADGSLRRNKSTNAVDGANLAFVTNDTNLPVGRTGGGEGFDRAAVMPFQLPNFGDVDNPFLSAHFEGYLSATATEDGLTAALYGLDRRSTADILDSDYYGLTDELDPDATLLQAEFLTWDMDINSPFYSKSGGNRNLLAFLNEQYAGGEGAGEFVFLRINTNEDSNQSWTLHSGNRFDESRRPQLRFISAFGTIAIPEPSSFGMLALAMGGLHLRRRREQRG